jgi:hypothetical protein
MDRREERDEEIALHLTGAGVLKVIDEFRLR